MIETGSEQLNKDVSMITERRQTEAVVQDAVRIAGGSIAGNGFPDFLRRLYVDFVRMSDGRALSAQELADAALPLWQAASGGHASESIGDRGPDSYAERLSRALSSQACTSSDLADRYADAFPPSYRSTFSPEEAATDVAAIEAIRNGQDIGVSLAPGDAASCV